MSSTPLSHSQEVEMMNIDVEEPGNDGNDNETFGNLLADAFKNLHVSGEVQVPGSTSQSSTGIIMNDTFAVLTSPQASPIDPKFVPVPDSGSENGD
eukprot:2500833-Amphidinium_carterae.1